jgi:predicted lipid-binding transport protein (Tim44 family)
MDMIVLLIIAGVALMVLAKLYAVLGKDVGAPPPLTPTHLTPVPSEPAPQIQSQQNIPSFSGLAALQKADPGFTAGEFLQGAQAAYEMIVEAFSTGDRETLQTLLTEEVYANYDQAITEREKKGLHLQTDIVRMSTPKIVEADLDQKMAHITVEFHSDLSMVEKDEDGELLQPDETGVAETTEQWVFSRPLNSRDPNWLLSAVAAIA